MSWNIPTSSNPQYTPIIMISPRKESLVTPNSPNKTCFSHTIYVVSWHIYHGNNESSLPNKTLQHEDIVAHNLQTQIVIATRKLHNKLGMKLALANLAPLFATTGVYLSAKVLNVQMSTLDIIILGTYLESRTMGKLTPQGRRKKC